MIDESWEEALQHRSWCEEMSAEGERAKHSEKTKFVI